MPDRSRKHEDVNQIASRIIGEITGETEKSKEKNPAAVSLGRLGGLKGGHSRAKKLTYEERRRIALKAANMRWHKEL